MSRLTRFRLKLIAVPAVIMIGSAVQLNSSWWVFVIAFWLIVTPLILIVGAMQDRFHRLKADDVVHYVAHSGGKT